MTTTAMHLSIIKIYEILFYFVSPSNTHRCCMMALFHQKKFIFNLFFFQILMFYVKLYHQLVLSADGVHQKHTNQTNCPMWHGRNTQNICSSPRQLIKKLCFDPTVKECKNCLVVCFSQKMINCSCCFWLFFCWFVWLCQVIINFADCNKSKQKK